MHLSLRGKLLAGTGIILVLMLLVGGVGLFLSNETMTFAEEKMESVFASSDGAMESRGNYLHAVWAIQDAHRATESSQRESAHERFISAMSDFENTFDELKSSEVCPEGLVQKMESASEAFQKAGDAYFSMLRERRSGSSLGATILNAQMDECLLLATRLDEVMEVIEEGGQGFEGTDAFSGRTVSELVTHTANSRLVLIIMLAIGLVLGVTISFLLARNIVLPIRAVTEAATSLAEGNLDTKLDDSRTDEIGQLARGMNSVQEYMGELAGVAEKMSAHDLRVTLTARSTKDRLGNSFIKMADNLREIIRNLHGSATELQAAAEQIGRTAHAMSNGSQDQSERFNQIAAAVEEITVNITEASRNAESISMASRDASTTATDGGQIVAETVRGMVDISVVVADSAKAMGDLADSANKIGEIISVIDDIADQTNLLALNAAIEAARAGEQGRGFAVVADEVRKLAERTSKATGEISGMIREIQKRTGNAVSSMQSASIKVDDGKALTDKAGSALSEIVSMSDRMVAMITQMAQSASQQAQAASEISQNISQVSVTTEQTARDSADSLQASNRLSEQARSLRSIVDRFVVS